MRTCSTYQKQPLVSLYSKIEHGQHNWKIRIHMFEHKIREGMQIMQLWKNHIRRGSFEESSSGNQEMLLRRIQEVESKMKGEISKIEGYELEDGQIRVFASKIWVIFK